jgi:hypothetical protein
MDKNSWAWLAKMVPQTLVAEGSIHAGIGMYAWAHAICDTIMHELCVYV